MKKQSLFKCQYAKFSQNILICTFSMSGLFVNPRSQSCASGQTFAGMFNFNVWPICQPKKSELCFRSNICWHVVLHFFPLNLVCNTTTFREKKWTQGSRVCKGAGYLLAWSSMLRSR